MAAKRPPKNAGAPRGKTLNEADFWADGVRAAPRADIETPNANRSRQRIYRWGVWVILALFPFMTIGYLALLPGYFQAQEAAAAGTAELDAPIGKQAAMQALTEWLEAEPNPLPGGHIISWDGVSEREQPTVAEVNGSEQTIPGFEVHDFTVGTGGTAIFDSQIQISVDEDLGTLVHGTPSIVPTTPSALNEASFWPGYTAETALPAVQQAATSWADAFTSGDPSDLGLATGDPDPEHSYMPMPGTTGHANLAAGDSVTRDDGYTVVRVSFTPLWNVPEPTEDPDDRAPEPEDAPPITYDLLVEGADTAAPTVVAWGGPGGVYELEPYGNALVGIDLSNMTPESGTEAVTTEITPEGS